MNIHDCDELVARPADGDQWDLTDDKTGHYLATVPLSELHAAQEAGINIRNAELVVTYRDEDDGQTYEIDHLGIGNPRQWGEFVVYCDDEYVVEFTTEAALHKPGHRADLPGEAELIRLARESIHVEDPEEHEQ